VPAIAQGTFLVLTMRISGRHRYPAPARRGWNPGQARQPPDGHTEPGRPGHTPRAPAYPGPQITRHIPGTAACGSLAGRGGLLRSGRQGQPTPEGVYSMPLQGDGNIRPGGVTTAWHTTVTSA
jgi:hypothetical protein